MTKWILDIYRSCLCLKQCQSGVSAKYMQFILKLGEGRWENWQVFAGVTVGKHSKCKWCRNVVMLIGYNFTSYGHLQQRLAVSLGALFFCVLWKKWMALCYHRASTVSYLIRITYPSDHTPEVQKYQNTDSQPSDIYFKFVSRIFLYFWLLYWLLHWHLYIWNVLFSKARVLRNNATHSLQMFMLFRTNYIYFCLLFTICIVPRLLENMNLLSPLIKWRYSKSYSWCLGSFCMLWTGSKEKDLTGQLKTKPCLYYY